MAKWRTFQINTYIEGLLFELVEETCNTTRETRSDYVRRLIIKDLIDRDKLPQEKLVALAQ